LDERQGGDCGRALSRAEGHHDDGGRPGAHGYIATPFESGNAGEVDPCFGFFYFRRLFGPGHFGVNFDGLLFLCFDGFEQRFIRLAVICVDPDTWVPDVKFVCVMQCPDTQYVCHWACETAGATAATAKPVDAARAMMLVRVFVELSMSVAS
jgi:hypothetical protein